MREKSTRITKPPEPFVPPTKVRNRQSKIRNSNQRVDRLIQDLEKEVDEDSANQIKSHIFTVQQSSQRILN